MEYLLATFVALFGWWFSTGLILFLNHQPAAVKRASMLLATAGLVLVLLNVPATAAEVSTTASMLAFGQALVIWGWLEMGYLMGFVTGPSNRACPPDATGWTRFSLALKTSLYHEMAVVALVLLVVLLSAGAPNQVTMLTCVALWLMRWSAKLNLFLGVSNFHEEWLPEQQRYLVTYMAEERMNPLLPLSLALGGGCAGWFLHQATHVTGEAASTGYLLVGVILALGVLEHLFLVLPVEDSRLWQWALPRHQEVGNQGA